MQAIDWWERAAEAAEDSDLQQAGVYYQKAESIALAYMQWLDRCVVLPPAGRMPCVQHVRVWGRATGRPASRTLPVIAASTKP